MKLATLGRIAGVLALTVGLAGCIDMTQDIKVTSTTTAAATITQTMGADIYAMVKAAGEGDSADSKPFCKAEGDVLTENADGSGTCVMTSEGAFADLKYDADDNSAKSYTMAVHSQVTSALSVGASMYTDRIAAGSPSLGASPVPEDVTVQLFGGFATYLGRQLELISEFQRSEHRSNPSGTMTATNALYVYGGYRFGSLVPYVRYDDLQFPTLDPYFVSDNFRQALLGARYDLGSAAVLKAEIARRKTSAAGKVTLLTLQAAVGF